MARARLRPATLHDLDDLVLQRRRMWEDMRYGTEAMLDEADPVYRRWLRARLRNGTVHAWVAEAPGRRVVAGGCLWLRIVHPRPGFPGGPEPYLMSFWTHPDWRGQGLARRIVQECVKRSKREGYPRVTLHASEMGRPIYEKLGFTRTWEMKLEPGKKRARAAKPSR